MEHPCAHIGPVGTLPHGAVTGRATSGYPHSHARTLAHDTPSNPRATYVRDVTSQTRDPNSPRPPPFPGLTQTAFLSPGAHFPSTLATMAAMTTRFSSGLSPLHAPLFTSPPTAIVALPALPYRPSAAISDNCIYREPADAIFKPNDEQRGVAPTLRPPLVQLLSPLQFPVPLPVSLPLPLAVPPAAVTSPAGQEVDAITSGEKVELVGTQIIHHSTPGDGGTGNTLALASSPSDGDEMERGCRRKSATDPRKERVQDGDVQDGDAQESPTDVKDGKNSDNADLKVSRPMTPLTIERTRVVDGENVTSDLTPDDMTSDVTATSIGDAVPDGCHENPQTKEQQTKDINGQSAKQTCV